ncbi:MAG TPA: OmpA family protein [Bacteroidetes bacterium]|nr:OmpA family protein [Bacteroidota bacterium]
MFDNLDSRYQVEEIYDEEKGVYTYYIGKPMKDFEYANAFKKELVAMGYTDVRIMQFVYSTLSFDEYFIDYMDDSGELVFVIDSFEEIDPLTVYFGFDQYFLAKPYRAQIDELLVKTNGRGYLIVLEGHSDDIGNEDYNLWLSEMRANTVKKYMVEVGVDPQVITIEPMGELNPIVPNDSLSNRRLNRSVIILPKKQ